MHPLRGWCRDRRGGLRAARDDLERPRLQPSGLGDLPRPAHRVVEEAAGDRRHRPAPGPRAAGRTGRFIRVRRQAGRDKPVPYAVYRAGRVCLGWLPDGARVSGSVTSASTASSLAPEASRTGLTERFADSIYRPQPGSNTCPPSRVGRRNACTGACLAAMSRSDRHSATRRCTRRPSLRGSWR